MRISVKRWPVPAVPGACLGTRLRDFAQEVAFEADRERYVEIHQVDGNGD